MIEILAKLTADKKAFTGQVMLRNGMQILTPRRIDPSQDPEWATVRDVVGVRDTNPYDDPRFYVGLLVAPGATPHAPAQFIKILFDAIEAVGLIAIPEDQLPKVPSDKSVSTPGGNRTKGGLVLP